MIKKAQISEMFKRFGHDKYPKQHRKKLLRGILGREEKTGILLTILQRHYGNVWKNVFHAVADKVGTKQR